MSPLSFCKASCFFIFFPLPKHSFETHLLGPSSLPILVCMHWGTFVVFANACLSRGSSFELLGQSLQPASLLERKWFLTCLGRSQLLISNVPGQRTKFEPVTTTQCQHPVLGPTGAFEKIWISFWYCFGCRSAQAPSLQIKCAWEWQIACRGLPKPGQAATRDAAWSWPLQHAFLAYD